MKKVILTLLLLIVATVALKLTLWDSNNGEKESPQSDKSNTVKVKIDKIDIYIENSVSMNGYVTGTTAEYESDLLVLLNNVKNSEETNSD
jgi:hypothetical protein